jgi:hypothetical protein
MHVFLEVSGAAAALQDALQSLAKEQSVAHRVKLHVWNNNAAIKAQVSQHLAAACV